MLENERLLNILLISGKAGVGKTTFARMVQSELLKNNEYPIQVIIAPFAQEVKNTAKMLGWDGKKDDRGRRFLQQIGDVAREYDKNTWVRKMYFNIKEQFLEQSWGEFLVIVDDWRFFNEKEFLLSLGCSLNCIRIEAPEREILRGTPEYNHISEIELPSMSYHAFEDNIYNVYVDNSGSIELLEKYAIQFANWISKKIKE